jgi:hypothetical protein
MDGQVCDLAYSHDGELLAVLTANPAMLLVLHAGDGSHVMSSPLPEGGGQYWNNVRFSPDRRHFTSVAERGAKRSCGV